MQKWSVEVMSSDPFVGTTMYFYADDAELLNPVSVMRIDNFEMLISQTLEITANGAKFNFGIKIDEGFFHILQRVE